MLCVDTAESRWVLPPLRAVWVPAGTAHTVTAKADSQMSALYFNPDTRPATLDSVTVVSVSPLLRELIHHVQHDPPTGAPRHHLEVVIIDQLTVAPAAPLKLPRLQDPRLCAIADILEVNPRDQRTLREYGQHIGANERTLQRLFAAETGTTFGQWRTQLRLQRGIVALGQGHNVTATASICGYSEPSAFIAAFRSAFGTTPARYFTQQETAEAPK